MAKQIKDNPTKLVFHAFHQSVSLESGAAAVQASSSDFPPEVFVDTFKASGRALECLAVLLSVRSVKHLITEYKLKSCLVEVITSKEQADNINLYLATGTISIPSTISPLLGLVGLLGRTLKDTEIVFKAGETPASIHSELGLLVEERLSLLRVEDKKLSMKKKSWSLPEEDQKWVDMHNATVVYTDASFCPYTGSAGWAWYVNETKHDSSFIPAVSSVEAELIAAFTAIESIAGPVLVVSDATIENIVRAWQEFDYFDELSAGLSDRLTAALQAKQVRFLWVKGHSDCPGNIHADRLAGDARVGTWAEMSLNPTCVAEHLATYASRKEATKMVKDAKRVVFSVARHSFNFTPSSRASRRLQRRVDMLDNITKAQYQAAADFLIELKKRNFNVLSMAS